MDQHSHNVMKDFGIIILSIVMAVILAKTGILESLLTSTQEWRVLGSLLAGFFFVSVFTAAPASVALVEIARANSAWEVALFGGIGALIGDLLIFRFIKDNWSEDIRWLIRKTRQERLASVFQLKLFRWLVPFVGALIIASPLPDEIGLAMLGLSKLKAIIFIPLSFALNFFGILLIGMIAKWF